MQINLIAFIVLHDTVEECYIFTSVISQLIVHHSTLCWLVYMVSRWWSNFSIWIFFVAVNASVFWIWFNCRMRSFFEELLMNLDLWNLYLIISFLCLSLLNLISFAYTYSSILQLCAMQFLERICCFCIFQFYVFNFKVLIFWNLGPSTADANMHNAVHYYWFYCTSFTLKLKTSKNFILDLKYSTINLCFHFTMLCHLLCW